MEVEIYADSLFLINFIMDYFILFVVSKLSKKNVSQKRLVICSCISALLYCLVIFFLEYSFVIKTICTILLIIIPVLITYSPKSFFEFLKLLILLYIITFFIGGAGIAIFYLINSNSFLSYSLNNFPFKILIFSTIISYISIKILVTIIKSYFVYKEIFDVNIFLNDKNISTKALLDTGNSLYDPETLKPVIIAEFEIMKDFLPESKVKSIPFSSLGKQNGTIIAITVDKLEIKNRKGGDLLLKNVLIGIHDDKLSKDRSYQMLLHPDIFS